MGNPTFFEKVRTWILDKITFFLPRRLVWNCGMRIWEEVSEMEQYGEDADWYKISFGEVMFRYL